MPWLALSANVWVSTELLAPLTSAADLPTHPSLSVPYRSKTLSDMVQQACTMLHRERKTLWGVKQLLTKLRGDETWIPCGNIESEIDNIIFDTKSIYQEAAKLGIRSASFDFDDQRQNNESGSSRADKQDNPPTKDDHQKFSSGAQMNATSEASIKADINIEADPPDSGQNVAPGHVFDIPAGGKADFEVIDAKDHPDEETPLAEKHSSNELGRSENYPTRISESAGSDPNLTNGAPSSEPLDVAQDVKMINSAPRDRQAQEDEKIHLVDGKPAASTNGVLIASDGKTEKGEGSVGEGDVKPAPHRMRTRAQAQAASDKTASSRTRSVSPVPWVPPPVHPLYLMPASARPDRNFGLPAEEAEEIRRMVMLYIQKQEEVCRGAEKLYIGLLRADRMRKTVFKWCKAEGHIGEMSDGEDWYDKEEWGLDEDLRKGHDDEEDDAATQVKKTRGRRS